MSPTPETHRPPSAAELSEGELTEKYQREFGQKLEKMRIPETSSVSKDALILRAEIERKFFTAINLTKDAATFPDGVHDRIIDLWDKMTDDYEKYVALHAKAMTESLAPHMERTDAAGAKVSLSDDIERAFNTDEGKRFLPRLKNIMAALESDPMSPDSKRYYPKQGKIDGAKVADDQKYIDELMKGSTPEQNEVLMQLRAALDQVAAGDPIGHAAEQAVLEKKDNYRQTPVAGTLKMILMVGSAVMTAWSLKAKNGKLTAFYGGLTVLLANPDLVKGADYRALKNLKQINTAEMRDLRAKYLRTPEGRAAVEEIFAMQRDGARRTLLRKTLNTGAVSIAQAQELVGGDKKSPLYATLLKMKDDRERRQFIWNFTQITNRDSQKLALQYIEAEGMI